MKAAPLLKALPSLLPAQRHREAQRNKVQNSADSRSLFSSFRPSLHVFSHCGSSRRPKSRGNASRIPLPVFTRDPDPSFSSSFSLRHASFQNRLYHKKVRPDNAADLFSPAGLPNPLFQKKTHPRSADAPDFLSGLQDLQCSFSSVPHAFFMHRLL